MTRKCLAVAALAALFAGVASAQDARTVIANATKAMGYENLNTIQYSGPISHEGAGLGQWISPAKGWHHNTVRDFTRFIDVAAGTSQRNGTSKREGDAATGMLPGGAGLDPSAAPGVAGTTNIAATAGFVARLDVTLSPPVFLKLAAAAPGATVRNQGRYKVVSFDSDQKAPSGVAYKISGYINNQNMLEKVETAYEDVGNGYIFGDILVEQIYSDYKDFGGVKFPTKITQNRAGVLYSDATIADVKANGTAPAPIVAAAGGRGGAGAGGAPGGAAGAGRGGAGGGAPAAGAAAGAPGAGGRGAGAAPGGGAPGGGGRGGDGAAAAGGRGGAPAAGAAAGGAAAAPAAPRKLADGVFVIIVGGSRALAVDMKDGIVLVDAPLNGIDAMVAQARQAIPNKQISHVITTHLHFDHVGGIRTALADGPKEVTLVTHDMSKDVIEKWFSNPRTLQAAIPAPGAAAPAPAAPAPAAGGGRGGAAPAPWPDALARSGKKVKFQFVKEKWTLKDDNHTIEVHPIKGAIHGEDMVVVYLPKEKMIFQSDAYNPGQPGAVTGPNNGGQLAFQKLLASELDRLKIDYETIVAGHTREASKQDLLVAIGRVPPPAPAAPAGGGQRQKKRALSPRMTNGIVIGHPTT